MSKKYLIIPLLLLPLLFLGAGCAKQTATVTPPTPEYTGTYQSGTVPVAIANYAFSPADVYVEKGTTVEWTNLDSTPHRVQLDTGVGSLEMKKDGKWAFIFRESGKYTYHCSIHPSMVGTVYVK